MADATLMLLHADTQSHVRLHQHALPANGRYLVNQFMTSSQLQQDILLLWQETLASLVPTVLHRDESMAESLAAKQPVGRVGPDSKISRESIPWQAGLLICAAMTIGGAQRMSRCLTFCWSRR